MEDYEELRRQLDEAQETTHKQGEYLEGLELMIGVEIARMMAERRRYCDLLEEVEAVLPEGPLRERVRLTLASLEESMLRYHEGREG